MEVFITGGSGFVGTALCSALVSQGHAVTVLSRKEASCASLPPGVSCAVGDPTRPGPWQEKAAQCQGFINLAGASIFGNWTRQYKELLVASRVETTKNLVAAMGMDPGQAGKVLVSASAVGYYGFQGDEELDEGSPPGGDFLAKLCVQWEAAAQEAEKIGARVVRARFGIVMGGGGGALEQMLPIFKKGLGGPLGSGRQWISWVHRQDLVSAILRCLEDPELSGPVNLTAPNPVTNKELTKALGQALNKPAFLPVPGFALKLKLGEMATVLLNGQRVLPRRLLSAGFVFAHPELAGALRDILVQN